MVCNQCGSSNNRFYASRRICAICVLARRTQSGYKPSIESRRKYKDKERDKHRQIKEELVSRYGSVCNVCQGIYTPEVFDFHHLDPSTKDFEVSQHTGNLNKALSEVQKCIMVCANCHRMIHAGRIEQELHV